MIRFNTVTSRGHVGSQHIPLNTQTDTRSVAKSMPACLKMTNVRKARGEWLSVGAVRKANAVKFCLPLYRGRHISHRSHRPANASAAQMI